MNRRDFVRLAAAGAASSVLSFTASELPAARVGRPRIKAVAFDAFPVFDPRPVFALAEELFPGQGSALSDTWRIRQFEYAWLRAISRHYADFWEVTQDALVFAARQLKLPLDSDKREKLMRGCLKLALWPDVLPALKSMKNASLRLILLSNLTPTMLAANIEHSGLHGVFEHVLSTDLQRTYKPDPRAYELGITALGLQREEILFAAFAGWDAAGAKLFGYPTFWVNRSHSPAEQLDATPDGSGDTLSLLVQFLNERR